MMNRLLFWAAVLVPTALAADAGKDNLHAWFQDGTCIEFFSESTGSAAPTSTGGSVIVDNSNIVHRVVTDARRQVLFAYDVVARRAPGLKDVFVVQIRPAGNQNATTRGLTAVPAYASPTSLNILVASEGRTVSALRDFPAVKRGEAVKVDILRNPATGETIYDVLRPSDDPPPSSARVAPQTEELILGSFQISINGEKFAEESGAILSGAAARIYVPGHGTYLLSLEATPGFQEVGHANGQKLSFSLANEYVEIASKQNVLKQSSYRPVWVLHDFSLKPAETKVQVMTADKVEWMMPKKR